jgi:hypothetical protein
MGNLKTGVIEAMQNVVIFWHLAIAKFNREDGTVCQYLKSKQLASRFPPFETERKIIGTRFSSCS